MSVLNAINEIKKKDKIKQTTLQVKKQKTTQTTQPQQPNLTPQQIAGLQQMKASKQAEIAKKTTPPPVKTTSPKVPYGTKGNLKTSTGENIPRIVNPIATGLTKVASFGTSSLLPGMKEAEAQAQAQFPKSYIAGQVLGYAAPTGLATGLTKGLVKGATKKIGSEIGKRVVEGAIVGTTAEGTQIVKPLITKEITPEQAGKQLATGLVAGAGLDIGLGVLGKVFKSLPKAAATKIKTGATLSNTEKLNIVKELGLPEGTTADDYIRQMQDLAKSEDIVNIPKQREADQVEQYYKSFEKELPTQQQIVKPIIEQEQQLVKPIIAQEQSLVKPITVKINKLKLKIPEEVYYRGEMQSSKIGEKPNILRHKEITDVLEIDPIKTKEKIEKTIQNAKKALNTPNADKDFYNNEIYQAQTQLKNVEEILKHKRIREEASKIPVSYVTSQKETAKLYANQAKEAAKKLGYNSQIFGDVSELQKPIIKKFKLAENKKTLDLTKYGENGFANIDEIEQILKNEFGISGKELENEIDTLYNSRFYNQYTDSMPVYALFKDENLINNYKRLKDNVDVIRYSEGNQDNYAILNRDIMKEIKLPTIKKLNTKSTERPTTIVKPLIEPTVTKQIKTSEIEPQGVKNIAEFMNVPKTEKTSIRMDNADNVNFRKTIKNSLMKSELPEDLKDAYVKNPSIYEKSNNEDDWAKAWQKVSDNYESSKATLRSKDALEGADDTMEYIALLHKAAKGDISEAKQLADEFAEKGTNAGKAIQAIVALQKTTPEGQLVRATQTIREVEKNIIENNPTLGKQYKAAKKEIEEAIKENAPLTEVETLAQKYKVKLKASEEKTYENLLNALAKKYKVPTLTDAEAKQIVDLMEKANKVDGREQEILFAKVDQMIADKVPASMGDKIRALRNLSLLGNIKTIGIRNPLGNLIFTGLENVSQIPSGITDKMVSKLLKTQRTTKVLPSLTTQAKGFKKGVQESWEDVINNVDTSPTRGGAELPRNRKIFEAAWLNKANNWMGDALKFGDRPFYQAAYDARLKELMDIAPDMGPEEMKKLANQFGLERTFQNESKTAAMARDIKMGSREKKGKGGLNTLNVGGFGLGDIVMPYTQTPANILEKGVQYTPLNIINILGKIAGQAAGKETIRNNQKAFVDAVGRTFTGTGAIALGYKLAKDGYISGTQKGDSSKEKAIKKQAGEQQYSVKIGDKWYSFDWAQPASIPLAVGADMYLAGEDEETLLGKLQAGAISGMDTVFNQSMMQGISRMFGGQSVSTGIVESIASAPSQFVPTLSGQAAQQKDQYKRDVDYSNIPEQIKTSAMKKIPGLREQLPETIDLFGEKTLEQGGRQGITKALSIFLSPTNISSETTDKITKDIYNLYKRTGETDVIPSKMPTGLSKEQEREFKITFGKDVKSSLEKLMLGSFDSLPDDRKVKLIKNAIDDAYSRSKDKLGIGKK